MDFSLSEEQQMIVKTTHDFVVNELYPHEAEIEETTDPVAAVTGAAVVYTDVWTSMGQEKERQQRLADLRPYQVNEALMKHCPDALFMHCLPARRGEEVTDGVIDGPQSVVVEEAANRMHVQKGLLAWLLGPQK